MPILKSARKNHQYMSIDSAIKGFRTNSGVSIQNAMPNISAEDREFIKTGVTTQEWDDTFGAE